MLSVAGVASTNLHLLMLESYFLHYIHRDIVNSIELQVLQGSIYCETTFGIAAPLDGMQGPGREGFSYL